VWQIVGFSPGWVKLKNMKLVWVVVLNATFNNIAVILLRSVLLVE